MSNVSDTDTPDLVVGVVHDVRQLVEAHVSSLKTDLGDLGTAIKSWWIALCVAIVTTVLLGIAIAATLTELVGLPWYASLWIVTAVAICVVAGLVYRARTNGRKTTDRTPAQATHAIEAGALPVVLEMLKLITEGDTHSWFAAWTALADRSIALAERTRDPLSKGNAYMRAHTYQRTGEFLLPPDDPRRPPSWQKTQAYFQKGLDVLGVVHEAMAVPYQGGALRALYFPGRAGSEAKPLIVLVGGYDSVLEELYFMLGRAALDRGYTVLMYEGPGQGDALRRHGLTFTPAWERPTAAVLDAFLRSHARPAHTVLIGMSLGGYFAPRVAAFEPRIDGVVAWDTLFDFGQAACPIFEAAGDPIASKNPDVAWGYANARSTMGTSNLEDTREAFAAYTLAPVDDRIVQDVLILAGAEDHVVPLHQTADFQKALVNARSVTTWMFDHASGGAQHCQAGNITLVHTAVFDWLIDKFGA
jgi:pimeloyl-ACP methyl ester carboxylesterase